jgi:TonB-dependent receptor
MIGAHAAPGQTAPPSDTGTINGLVTDMWEGKPMAGVVVLLRGTTLAATTDAAGRYTLAGVPPGDHIVTFSKSGFARATITEVRVAAGQATRVDLNLRPEFYEMEEYQITAEELAEQNQAILFERQKSSVLTDAIGSEMFARVGISDAAEAVSKVTGATIVDGKFAVIRGLADRYTASTLNGGEIPSADPYRKAAQLDQIPAQMIDRVVVSKTFTPDQPGGFTGGAINIVTRSFPEKFVFAAAAGVGYDTRATGNDDYQSYTGGKYDWGARDDGTRALPKAVADVPRGFLTAVNPFFSVAEYGSAQAAEEAAQRYTALQKEFEIREFGGTSKAPPPNLNLNWSLGDTTELFKRRLGLFAAFSYERKFRFYEGEQNRYTFPILNPGGSGNNDIGSGNRIADLDDTRSIEEVSWGGTANVAYELMKGHELAFTFLYTQNSEDRVRRQTGAANRNNFENGSTAYLNELRWTERNLTTYQLRGQHEFEGLDRLRADWLVSLATTTQDEPDYRLFNFNAFPSGQIDFSGSSGVPEPAGGPTRYFRELEENNQTYKLDLTKPFRAWIERDAELKAGGYFSKSHRDFIERTYTFTPQRLIFGNPDTLANSILPDELLGYDPIFNRGRLIGYSARTRFSDVLGDSVMNGDQEIKGPYAMLDLPVLERLRLIGGVRYEMTDLTVFSSSRFGGSGTNSIIERDFLPAAGLIYEVITNMNIRAHWAKTIARPTFREFSRLRSYDPTGNEIFIGNPFLQQTLVNNYDLRWEWFPRPGDVFSVGGFYKEIDAPLEKVAVDARSGGDLITYTNSPPGKVYGFEIEARTSLDRVDDLLRDFSVGANFAYIVSSVKNPPTVQITKAEVGIFDKDRPLYDQSPYVINADLTYDNARLGTTMSLAYSVAGERLYIVNNGGYDIYEQPAPQLDFFITQRLWKHWKLRFAARNLLNPEFERTYGKSGEAPRALGPYNSYRKGRQFTLSLSVSY